jgi:hypothetical protein
MCIFSYNTYYLADASKFRCDSKWTLFYCVGKRGSTTPSGASAYSFNWAELQRKSLEVAAAAATASDVESVASTTTLVDGTQLTPQQLGLMGMEALETTVAYWEDALRAYEPPTPVHNARKHLTTAEESKAQHLLEALLEEAYHLQERAEAMFIYQNSALYSNAQV